MIRAASTPRYSDERQHKLEKWADGYPSAVSQNASGVIGIRYFPSLNGDVVSNNDTPPGGFVRKNDAINAARRFKIKCRDHLAEPTGSM